MQPSDAMIERVANALADMPNPTTRREQAEIAVMTYHKALPAEGFAVVPVELPATTTSALIDVLYTALRARGVTTPALGAEFHNRVGGLVLSLHEAMIAVSRGGA